MRIDERVSSVREIDFQRLIDEGKRVFLFDFDNTLGLSRTSQILPWAAEVLERVKQLGGDVLIASNGRPRNLRIPYPVVWRALKPIPFKVLSKFKDWLRNRKTVVVIGDQLFTDVLLGNLMGCYTIMVDPIEPGMESKVTRLLRALERFYFSLSKRRYKSMDK